MAQRTDGGALGWAVRSALLALAVCVGSNFVRSVTHALSVATDIVTVRTAQPIAPPVRGSFDG